MAVGVPVISSNTGGIPEVNTHGYSGYLSDVGDVVDMAKNMLFLLQEENLKKFKVHAKERSKAFSLNSILTKYEEIYLNLIKAKSTK